MPMIQTRGLGSRCFSKLGNARWYMYWHQIKPYHQQNWLDHTRYICRLYTMGQPYSDAACHGNACSCALTVMLSFVASSEGGWMAVAVQASLQQPCHPSPAPVDHLQRPPPCSSPPTFCCPSSPVPCWPRHHLNYLLSSSSRTELGHSAAAERHHDLSLAITCALTY